MNHEALKQVIFDQHAIIRNTIIVDRDYAFESKANYIVVGMRRAGKSTLLYKKVQELIAAGVQWPQIIYVNFEDERLAGFALSDFNDIVQTAAELSSEKPYYFLDEVQNIEGWERFARRLADAHESVFVTGSNASMLSSEMEQRLGGRYLTKEVSPYDFAEFLDASGVPHDDAAMYGSRSNGRIRAKAREYMQDGGFPESIDYNERRSYAESVYQKVLLGDIAARYTVKNVPALRLLMKKVAETVTSPVSFTKLRNAVNASGVKCSTDTVMQYIDYAEEAYLLFTARNFIAKFSERESTPKYYFSDNGLLNLFLVDKKSLLLENVVAIDLQRRFGEGVYYFKSQKTGIDIDFYVPGENAAVQVCLTLDVLDYGRETSSLVRLAKDSEYGLARSIIVTLEDDEKTIEIRGIPIEIMPLYRFLLR